MAERNETQPLIYGVVNCFTHQIFYVGETTQLLDIRLSEHVSKVRKGQGVNPEFQAEMEEILNAGGYPLIVELNYVAEDEDEGEKEREMIAFYQIRGYHLANKAAGGPGQLGRWQSDETKQKISQSQAKRHAERKLQIVK